MARLPHEPRCTAGALLVRGLGEFNWDGEPDRASCAPPATTYFESRAPYGVRWEGDGRRHRDLERSAVPDDVHGRPPRADARADARAVPRRDPARHVSCSICSRTTPVATKALAAANVPTEPDPDIEQLAAFLRTLAIAARLEQTILVDG